VPIAGVPVLRDQASHLGAGEAAELEEMIPDQSLVGLDQPQVAELAQRGFDPVIGLSTGGKPEVEGGAAAQKRPDLVQTL